MLWPEGPPLQSTVDINLKGKFDRVVVDGADALVASLKAKARYPEIPKR